MPKTGKTTLATQMDGCLLLAFESGYNALPGVIAQDIFSWGEMKQVFRELQEPEVKNTFKAIIVDTVDVAADKCRKYICRQNGITDLGELQYGKGWSKFKDEFNEVFRGLASLGYAVFFIGHHKEMTLTDPNTGIDKIIIRPSLSTSSKEVIAGMADIYGYAHQKKEGEMSVLTLRDSSGNIECGCRFKYIANEIPTNYQSLVNTIREAIDREAEEHNGKFITEEKITIPLEKTFDYDALMEEFSNVVGDLMQNNSAKFAPMITSIIEKYLGKGKKVSETTRDQAEFIYLILNEIKEDLLKN